MCSKPEKHGNRWRVVWTYRDARQRFYRDTFDEAMLAYVYIEALRDQIVQTDAALLSGAYRDSSLVQAEVQRQATAVRIATTFGALAEAHIDKRAGKAKPICPRTVNQYQWYLSTYLAEWAPLQVARINGQIIKAMADKLEFDQGRSGKVLGESTRYGVMGFALAVLKAAFEDGVITTDVGAEFRDINQGIRVTARELRRIRALERPEYDALVAFAPNQMARDMMDVLAFTGKRIAELLALQVKHVNLDRSADIVVKQQWGRVKGGPAKLAPCKAGSNRRIDITPKLVVLLSSYVEGRGQDEFVFTDSLGKPWSYANFMARCWNPMVKAARAAGVISSKPITPHDLRHSHASWLLSKGVPVEVVAKRLGHRRIEMTINTYREFLDDDRDNVRRALEG